MLGSCGYHNPYVYSGPERSIYVATWKNRSSVLDLDSRIYQSLIEWFQKSGSIKITKNKEGADLILAGEIITYDVPTLAYATGGAASNVKLRLQVRYILKDLKTGKVLIERPSEDWMEDYRVTSSSTQTKENEDAALDVIIDELSQKIYRISLGKMSQL